MISLHCECLGAYLGTVGRYENEIQGNGGGGGDG